MSPLVEIGATFKEAEKAAEFKTVPSGVYQLQCVDVTPFIGAKTGRPCLKWRFETIGQANPELNKVSIFNNTPLPHEGEFSGVGFLVDTTSALGKPWTSDKMETNDYIGKQAKANVVLITPNEKNQLNKPKNEISSWVK